MALIKNVNHSIDNAPVWSQSMTKFFDKRQKLNQYQGGLMKNPYDLFNIVSGGHRSYGHDLRTGMFLSAMNARAMQVPASHAMLATMAHYMADSVSNRMVNTMGTDGRNLFAALYNWQTRKNQNKSMF